MDIGAWDHWLLLRPLFAFLLALPLLIVALFVGRHLDRRDAKRAGEAEVDHKLAENDEARRAAYEGARSALRTPRAWTGESRADRRVA